MSPHPSATGLTGNRPPLTPSRVPKSTREQQSKVYNAEDEIRKIRTQIRTAPITPNTPGNPGPNVFFENELHRLGDLYNELLEKQERASRSEDDAEWKKEKIEDEEERSWESVDGDVNRLRTDFLNMDAMEKNSEEYMELWLPLEDSIVTTLGTLDGEGTLFGYLRGLKGAQRRRVEWEEDVRKGLRRQLDAYRLVQKEVERKYQGFKIGTAEGGDRPDEECEKRCARLQTELSDAVKKAEEAMHQVAQNPQDGSGLTDEEVGCLLDLNDRDANTIRVLTEVNHIIRDELLRLRRCAATSGTAVTVVGASSGAGAQTAVAKSSNSIDYEQYMLGYKYLQKAREFMEKKQRESKSEEDREYWRAVERFLRGIHTTMRKNENNAYENLAMIMHRMDDALEAHEGKVERLQRDLANCQKQKAEQAQRGADGNNIMTGQPDSSDERIINDDNFIDLTFNDGHDGDHGNDLNDDLAQVDAKIQQLHDEQANHIDENDQKSKRISDKLIFWNQARQSLEGGLSNVELIEILSDQARAAEYRVRRRDRQIRQLGNPDAADDQYYAESDDEISVKPINHILDDVAARLERLKQRRNEGTFDNDDLIAMWENVRDHLERESHSIYWFVEYYFEQLSESEAEFLDLKVKFDDVENRSLEEECSPERSLELIRKRLQEVDELDPNREFYQHLEALMGDTGFGLIQILQEAQTRLAAEEITRQDMATKLANLENVLGSDDGVDQKTKQYIAHLKGELEGQKQQALISQEKASSHIQRLSDLIKANEAQFKETKKLLREEIEQLKSENIAQDLQDRIIQLQQKLDELEARRKRNNADFEKRIKKLQNELAAAKSEDRDLVRIKHLEKELQDARERCQKNMAELQQRNAALERDVYLANQKPEDDAPVGSLRLAMYRDLQLKLSASRRRHSDAQRTFNDRAITTAAADIAALESLEKETKPDNSSSDIIRAVVIAAKNRERKIEDLQKRLKTCEEHRTAGEAGDLAADILEQSIKLTRAKLKYTEKLWSMAHANDDDEDEEEDDEDDKLMDVIDVCNRVLSQEPQKDLIEYLTLSSKRASKYFASVKESDSRIKDLRKKVRELGGFPDVKGTQEDAVTIGELRSEIITLQRELDETKKEVDNLQESIDNCTMGIDRHDNSNAGGNRTSEISDIKCKLREQKEMTTFLSESLDNLIEELAECRKGHSQHGSDSIQEERRDIDSLEPESTSTSSAKHPHEVMIDKQRKENQRLDDRIRDLEAEVADLKKKLDECQQSPLAEADDQTQSKTEKILNDMIKRKDKEIEELKASSAEFERNEAECQKAKNALNEKIKSLKGKGKAASREASPQGSPAGAREGRRDDDERDDDGHTSEDEDDDDNDPTSDSARLRRENVRLKKKISRLENELATLRREIENYDYENRYLGASQRILENDYEQLQEGIKVKEAEITALGAGGDEGLRGQIQVLTARAAKLQKDLNRSSEETWQARKKREGRIAKVVREKRAALKKNRTKRLDPALQAQKAWEMGGWNTHGDRFGPSPLKDRLVPLKDADGNNIPGQFKDVADLKGTYEKPITPTATWKRRSSNDARWKDYKRTKKPRSGARPAQDDESDHEASEEVESDSESEAEESQSEPERGSKAEAEVDSSDNDKDDDDRTSKKTPKSKARNTKTPKKPENNKSGGGSSSRPDSKTPSKKPPPEQKTARKPPKESANKRQNDDGDAGNEHKRSRTA